MQNWTEMRRQDFDRAEPLTLFDAEPAALIVDDTGTLFEGGEQIPCNICGSVTEPRLSLGKVALCTDSTACYVRNEARRRAELAELFPEMAPGRRLCAHADDDEARARGEHPAHWLEAGQVCELARGEDAPAPVACLLCGRTGTARRLIGERRFGSIVRAVEVCDEGCNPAHRLDVERAGSEARFACSCGAHSRWYRTVSPIAGAAIRHSELIARMGGAR